MVKQATNDAVHQNGIGIGGEIDEIFQGSFKATAMLAAELTLDFGGRPAACSAVLGLGRILSCRSPLQRSPAGTGLFGDHFKSSQNEPMNCLCTAYGFTVQFFCNLISILIDASH